MAQLASDEVNDLLKAIMDKEIAGNNFIQTIIPQMSRDDFSARVMNMLRATLLQCWKEGRKGKILMN
jgi:hypothetical protein